METAVDFTPTRSAGLARLEAFVPAAGAKYAQNRNFDFGPDNRSNVSAISPWVRHRLVSERELVAAALDRFSLSTAEKFIQEVFWRTYWKGWLELRPAVWTRYTEERDDQIARLNTDESLNADYTAAIEGRTDIDCFDAWAKELVETGYLHNHTRMWFASIWVFTLRLPWTLGADFFFRHLMDGDPASNTLSWRWVCGLQTRGKTYAARASNIEKFTDGRFRPSGLNENPDPLTDAPFPEPLPLSPGDTVPKDKRLFIVMGDDDLGADAIDLGNSSVVGAATWSTIAARSPLEIGARAKAFSDGALADAARRFSDEHGADPARSDSAQDLANLIRDSGANAVLMRAPTTGPNRDELENLKRLLTGFPVVTPRRSWDERAWPHATKGFFPFKEKIPGLCRDAGLDSAPKRR